MNKSELSKLKNGLKNKNDNFNVLKMSHTYCKREEDSMRTIFTNFPEFYKKDESVQEKYLSNYKKLLTGKFGEKIFELNFDNSTESVGVQENLYLMLNEDYFEECSNELVSNLLERNKYNADVLVTIILGQTYLPIDKGEGKYHKFIFCSINALKESEKGLELDIAGKDLIEQESSIIVNISNPIEGFMFPSITDYKSNVNKIIYCTKSNRLNFNLTKEVLKCEEALTSKEEKEIFKKIIGEDVQFETLSNTFELLNNYNNNSKDGTISANDLVEILKKNGINDAVEFLSLSSIDKNAPIRIENLVPTGSKGIKINNSQVTVSVGSKYISNVKKSNLNGKNCLVIELLDSVKIEDFNII